MNWRPNIPYRSGGNERSQVSHSRARQSSHVLKGRQPGHHRRKAAADLVVGQVQVPARTHKHHRSPPRQASTQPTHACCCCARARSPQPQQYSQASAANTPTAHSSQPHTTRTTHRHTHSQSTAHAAHADTEANAHCTPHMPPLTHYQAHTAHIARTEGTTVRTPPTESCR
jgi:hypothetical protein